MQLLRLGAARASARAPVLTIGNFDGVHLGHAALIARMQAIREADEAIAAMSFYPHTRAVVQGAQMPFITGLRERLACLSALAVDYAVLVHFIEAVRTMSAEDFVREILQRRLGMRALVVGDDFRLGHRGHCDFDGLKRLSTRLGFALYHEPSVIVDGERVSSSAIREALAGRDLARARRFLGHDVYCSGRVHRGAGRGHHLQAATANIVVHPNWCLPDGVYIVDVRLEGSTQWLPAIANLGFSPTFESAPSQRRFEIHIIDFEQNIYQQRLCVRVHQSLRQTRRFANAKALKAQIGEDIAQARAFFNSA